MGTDTQHTDYRDVIYMQKFTKVFKIFGAFINTQAFYLINKVVSFVIRAVQDFS